MSGSGRKHVSKWDSKEDTHHPSVDVKSGSYYRDKESEPVRFKAESNASRMSTAAEDQHSGEARTRSRVSQNNDNSCYSEQDEISQKIFHRSNSRSYSRSRSRSRSPVSRARRDAGSNDRYKTRTRDEFSKRGGDQSSDYGWEDRTRKPREARYHTDDFREEAVMMKGGRSSDYDTDFPDERSTREHLHDGVSDPRLRRHRSEMTGEKETQRRDGGDGEGRFRRSSEIPCKFFAAGFCRNGQQCRFSHHGGADRKQPQDDNFYRHDNNYHSGVHNRWNDDERLDNGKLGRASKEISKTKGNGGSSWIDGMEMSPDWNYGAHNLKNPIKEEPIVGIIGPSSQSRAVKDNLVTNSEQRSGGMYTYGDKAMVEKPIADSHRNYNNTVNIAPVQAFSQNHNVLPYQNSLTAGGSQQQVITAAAAAADFSIVSNFNNPESGKAYQDNHHSMVEKAVPAQSIVTREQIDQISTISATIAQFLANGQPIPQLTQALQMPLHSESSLAVQPNQAAQSNSMSNNPNPLWGLGMSTEADGAPPINASQVSNIDGIQELPVNPKASEENGEKKTNEASKEEECKKTGDNGKDAENVVDEDEDDEDGSEEEDKKEKDPKGIRTFKFALVEIVKELLKPAWKEGKMKKDGYKNIVKKVVEKVTGSMQNVPQTQEKIDHYLSASKPKLTKLVQAYISKVKKT